MQYVSQMGPNIQAPIAKGIHHVKWGLGKAWLDKREYHDRKQWMAQKKSHAVTIIQEKLERSTRASLRKMHTNFINNDNLLL